MPRFKRRSFNYFARADCCALKNRLFAAVFVDFINEKVFCTLTFFYILFNLNKTNGLFFFKANVKSLLRFVLFTAGGGDFGGVFSAAKLNLGAAVRAEMNKSIKRCFAKQF